MLLFLFPFMLDDKKSAPNKKNRARGLILEPYFFILI